MQNKSVFIEHERSPSKTRRELSFRVDAAHKSMDQIGYSKHNLTMAEDIKPTYSLYNFILILIAILICQMNILLSASFLPTVEETKFPELT